METLERRTLFAAVTPTVLYNFLGKPDAYTPTEGLILVGNRLYGVSQGGGSHDDGSGTSGGAIGHKGGTIYAVNTDGSNYQVLHEFGGTLAGGTPDGYEPLANVTFFNGKLYGTTPFGGRGGVGTVFSINADGSGYTVLRHFGDNNPVAGSDVHEFDDGAMPWAPITVVNNKLYGIASAGGRALGSGPDIGNGVLFSMDPDGGNYTKVHVFDPGPQIGLYTLGLVTDGSTFYGITSSGGPTNAGTIYALGIDGSNYRVLHSFNASTEGSGSLNELTLIPENNTLVGTTNAGGANGNGSLFAMNTDGSNFRVIRSFSLLVDGAFPHSEVVRVGDKLYGTTSLGGPFSQTSITFSPSGNLYSTNLDGTGFQVLHSFNGLGQGAPSNYYGTLASDGTNFYGVTGSGGTGGRGTLYTFPISGVATPTSGFVISMDGLPIPSNQAGQIIFGPVARNAASPTKTFTITNNGNTALTLPAPTLPAGFTFTDPIAGTLAPGASDTFVIALSTKNVGTFSGDVPVVASNVGVPFTFLVTGQVTGSTGGGGNNGGGGGGTPDLTVQIAGKLPTAAISGTTKAKLSLKVTNAGTGALPATNTAVGLFLSADGTVDGSDTPIITVPVSNLKLKANQSKTVKASFTFPTPATDGTYRIVATVDPAAAVSESDETNNTAATAPLSVGKPSVNFTGTAKALTATAGKLANLVLSIQNTGTSNATRVATPIRVILSTDGTFDGVGETTVLDTTQSLTIPANKSKAVKLKLPALNVPKGTFSLQTLLDPDATTIDSNRSDNTITSTITVR